MLFPYLPSWFDTYDGFSLGCDIYIEAPRSPVCDHQLQNLLLWEIIQNSSRNHFVMWELGAAWGPFLLQAQQFHGCIYGLAVEPYWANYLVLRHNMIIKKYGVVCVHGAVGAYNGKAGMRINSHLRYTEACNQKITARDAKRGFFPTMSSVPMYQLDSLYHTYGFNQIDLVHMDAQGAEHEALQGATHMLSKGLVDHWIICTHSHELHDKVKAEFRKYPCYQLEIDIPFGGSDEHRNVMVRHWK